MKENNQEFIEYTSNENMPLKRRFPVRKLALVFLALGSATLLILTCYSYVTLTLKVDRLGKQMMQLSEMIAALPTGQQASAPMKQTIQETTDPQDISETEDDRDDEPATIQPKPLQQPLLPFIVAASEIREAVRRGTPFEQALLVLERSNDPVVIEKIAVMKPYANTGIKDVLKLRESFKLTAQNIKAVAQKDLGNAKEITARFSSLIKIRKIGALTEADTSMDAILSRAEKAISDSDIAKTINELKQLKNDEVIKLVAPWLADAEHSLMLAEQSAALYQHLVSVSYHGPGQ